MVINGQPVSPKPGWNKMLMALTRRHDFAKGLAMQKMIRIDILPPPWLTLLTKQGWQSSMSPALLNHDLSIRHPLPGSGSRATTSCSCLCRLLKLIVASDKSVQQSRPEGAVMTSCCCRQDDCFCCSDTRSVCTAGSLLAFRLYSCGRCSVLHPFALLLVAVCVVGSRRWTS